MVHAPMLAGSPRSELACVWARRPEAAAALAERHGTTAAASFEELLDRCEAVAFAVPPRVQAELAVVAAAAGKALLLEKPIAADVGGAERLADAAGAAGVATVVLLTWRFAPAIRQLLADDRPALGGRAEFVTDALRPGGPFATPWRLEDGALLDLGPHVVDVLDAALGPVVDVQARGDRHGVVALLLEHDTGLASTATLAATAAPGTRRMVVELHRADGIDTVDAAAAVGPSVFATVVDDLVAAVAGERRAPDVHRGLHVQRIVAAADAQLRAP
jgi:predicted dehydrogenase